MRRWSGSTAGRPKAGINHEIGDWVLHRRMSYVLLRTLKVRTKNLWSMGKDR